MNKNMLTNLKKVTHGTLALLIVVSSFGSLPVVRAGGFPTITIGSQSASNGDTINVPIKADFGGNVAGMDFSVQYDPTLLTYVGLTQNAISGHGTLTTNNANPIPINWFSSSALDIPFGSTILTLQFTVISATTTNASLTVVGAKEIVNGDGDVISTSSSFVPGVISLNPDLTAPIITLIGNATVNLTVGDTYTDAGATASDNVDGDITARIVTVNPVNTAIAGTYTVTYNVSDVAGNAAVALTRTVIVSAVVAEQSDLTALVVALNAAQSKHDAAVEGNLPGQYPAPLKANLLSAITTAATVNSTFAQSVVDAAVATLNAAVVTFEAGVVPTPPPPPPPPVPAPDLTSPVITLLGNATVNLTVGDTYTDAGATASDNVDGDITARIVTVNPVNTAIAGTYTVTYNVSDAAGNVAVALTRTVIVSEVVVPPVTVEPPRGGGGGGSAIVTLSQHGFAGSVTSVTFPIASAIAPTTRSLTPQVLGVRVFAENALLRVDGGSIYIAQGNTLHVIPNADVLSRFANRSRIDITAEDIVGYTMGSSIPTNLPTYVPRTLLRVNARDIYVVAGRTLHRVPNPHTLWPYRDYARNEVGDDALIEFVIGDSVPIL